MASQPVLIAQQNSMQALELSHALRSAGFASESATDGSSALRKAMTSEFGLVLLDVVLPDQDGPAICANMRREGAETPVIFVSSVDAANEKVRAFKSGADDYVTRPYVTQELILRIQAVLRRSRPSTKAPVLCRIGPSLVDLTNGRAERAGKTVPLTGKELELLRHLYERRERLVSREDLLHEVWRYTSTDTRTVDVHLSTLRQKLEHNSRQPQHLITVRKQGYMFAECPHVSDQGSAQEIVLF